MDVQVVMIVHVLNGNDGKGFNCECHVGTVSLDRLQKELLISR